jgi:SAM-dependent methyltransferase
MGSSADVLVDDEAALPEALRSDRRAFVTTDIYESPAWYDVDYAGYRAELPFYASLLERFCTDGLAVELGAGTGRLTIPLVQRGFRIHAVEPAAAMRALLLSKMASVGLEFDVEGAVAENFCGPETAPALVFFPFNGLLHVATREGLVQTFTHIHRKLPPGGCFAFDVTCPYWESMARGSAAWGRADERVHPVSGRRFVTGDRSRYIAATRTMHIDIRYAFVDGDDAGVQTALTQRMWTPAELCAVLEACGFRLETIAGDVDGAPFDDGSPRLIVSSTRGG